MNAKVASNTPGPDFRAVPLIADDLALDFLNSRWRDLGEWIDHLASDAAALDWLRQAGLIEDAEGIDSAPSGLAAIARGLRESICALVDALEKRTTASTTVINEALSRGAPAPQLQWDATSAPHWHNVRRSHGPYALLFPVAEAAGRLLCELDPERLRHCENTECVLRFADRSKAGRRRWCSMAWCGNRHKVAAFRARQGASS